MQKLRIAVFFLFAALSVAWADCTAFTISANGTSLGSGSSVSYNIMIGEDLEFTVDPEGESIVWWRVASGGDVAVSDKSSFSPPTSIDALGGNTPQSIIYKVRNCGIEKTITLALSARKYMVTFNSDGGSSVSSQNIEHGENASPPPPPTKTGYTFAYWYLDNENTAFDFTTPITDNITLKAKWNINQYTVIFNSDGGSAVSPQTVNHGSTATKPANPTRTGYTFERWELSGSEYNFSNPVTGNITLTANWNPKTYTISFDISCPATVGTCPANPPSKTVTYNAKIGTLTAPTLIDYNFLGWFYNNSQYTEETTYTIDNDITLAAKWQIKTFTVTFNSGGGSTVSPQTVNYGSTATKPSNPTLTGYTFVRWEYPVGTEYIFSTPVTGNITLTAKWDINQYTVTFNSDGGSTVSSVTVDYNTTVYKPSNPTRTEYDFVHWYLNNENTAFDFSTPIINNITLTAKWDIKKFTVAFNSNGGSAVPSQTVNYGSTATKPSNPTRTGYTFVRWESPVGTEYIFSTPVTSNITLTAKWDIINYTITYTYNVGTAIPPLTTSYNIESGPISLPSMQDRCGWVFEGWLDNPNLSGSPMFSFTPNANNLVDKNFYAKWTSGLMTPNANLLNYNIPNLIYSGQAIAPIAVSPKAENQCPLGTITVLYNGTGTLPKDAGTYAISASIAENDSYEATIIPLGNLIIGKANVTIDIESATAKNKVYDATATAEIETMSISFNHAPALLGSDKVSTSDYSIAANFVQANAGTSIPVTGTLTWLANGPLSKNYNISPSPLSFSSSADITQATGILKIEQPDYERLNPKSYSISNLSSFVKPSDIHIEYRKIDEAVYSTHVPNRTGTYIIKAWFDPTENYTGAIDSATFTVTRGNYAIEHTIEFKKDGFEKDLDSSGNLRRYYVAGTELCNIKSTMIQITVNEPDIILSLGKGDNNPQRIIESDENIALYIYDEIPFPFGKPGVDTLFYTLLSKDGIYKEYNTLLIETPIPFESITGQKWSNVLFINNNPKTNGGYEFESYKWFQNEKPVSETQFYSAGPSSADTLNPDDIYKVTMHTTDGMRISTCEGRPKIKTPASAAKPALTKQVLGINGKTAKTGSKVYNLKGSKTESTPAGVYIIEE